MPYPPGIPILMPGERLRDEENPHVKLLLKLQDFGQTFPGFGHEIHGIEDYKEDVFWMRCVIEDGINQVGEEISEKERKKPLLR